MSTIAEIAVSDSEFALESTFADVPGIEIEFDRAVARDGDGERPMAHLWVRAGDGERAEQTLRGDPTVEAVERLTDLDDKQLYRIEWCEATYETIDTLLCENVSVLEATGIDGWWQFRLLFPDREELSSFYSVCKNGGPTVDFRTIGPHEESPWCSQRDLSDKQRGSLRSALELGYYDVPREIMLSELAEELDVSHQALSERLRRGHGRIIEDTLAADLSDGQ